MQHEQLFSEIDKLYDKFIGILEDVCNIESPTSSKEAVDKCGQYFIDYALKKGWKVETVKEEVSGNPVFITMNPDAKGQPITLSGHIDTVHDIGSFGFPPVKRDGDIMHGPGVVDCKGGVVAALYAMEALANCGFDERPIMLLLQTDEEKGSKPSEYHTINEICKKALGSVAFLNLEGMKRRGTVVVARKGILRYQMKITGIDVHSSQCYNGANAITEAAHKIIELEKYKDENGITINCGTISGGTVANTVAKECSFTVDIRYSTKEQLEEAKAFVKTVSEKTIINGTTTALSEVSYRPAMEKAEKNIELVGKMNAVFEQCGMQKLEAVTANGGSDSAYSTQYGIPSVDSIGTDGGYIHTVREYVKLDSLRESAQILAACAAYIK